MKRNKMELYDLRQHRERRNGAGHRKGTVLTPNAVFQ